MTFFSIIYALSPFILRFYRFGIESFRLDVMELLLMIKSTIVAMRMSGGVLSFIVTGAYDFQRK